MVSCHFVGTLTKTSCLEGAYLSTVSAPCSGEVCLLPLTLQELIWSFFSSIISQLVIQLCEDSQTPRKKSVLLPCPACRYMRALVHKPRVAKCTSSNRARANVTRLPWSNNPDYVSQTRLGTVRLAPWKCTIKPKKAIQPLR